MKTSLLLLVTVCLVLLISASARKRQRPRPFNYERRSREWIPFQSRTGYTSDGYPCPVEFGCIKLPDNEDLIPTDVFEREVINVVYNVIYRIDYIGVDMLRRQLVKYVQNGDMFAAVITARAGNGTCLTFPNLELGSYDCRANGRAVITQTNFNFIGFNGTFSPSFYYLSDHPKDYKILLACIDSNTIRNGFCEGHFFVNVGVTQDPPHNPMYYEIETELRRKLGVTMSDPMNTFLYTGEGCPVP
ncbi:hypothetical protein ACF0H5_003165 [Mactra antiquata]